MAGRAASSREDTRFLSRLELRVNGARPLLLSSGTIEYFSAAFYLRNPVADGLGRTRSRSRASDSSVTACRTTSWFGTRPGRRFA